MPIWRLAGGWTVFSLRWQAWRDAWRAIPLQVSPDDGSVITPQMVSLELAARHDFSHEREKRDKGITALEIRRTKVLLDLELLRANLRELVDELASMGEVPAAALDVRRTGEVMLDLEVVRRRRRREAARAVAERQARLNSLKQQINELQTEMDVVPLQSESLHETYRTQLRMIDERARELMAFYWRTLARWHPERHTLNLRLKGVPQPLANWLVEVGERA